MRNEGYSSPDLFGTLQGFYNGTFLQTFDALATSDGATVTMSLEQSGGGDLIMRFSDGREVLDCTPALTIALTAGSDPFPTDNFIYILQSTKALTKSTSDWPDAEHIKIAYFFVPSAAFVQAKGCRVNQNWNDHDAGVDGQGHMSHMAERSRRLGAQYFSGVDGNGTTGYLTIVSGSTPDDVYFKSTDGLIYQMHRHTVPAIDMSGSDTAIVVNDFVAPYDEISNLNVLLFDALGEPLTNRYFNLVFWAVANKSGEYAPLMVNLPAGSYSSQASAIADLNGYDVLSMPAAFNRESSTGFLVCRVTLKHSPAGGGEWTHVGTVDLRGLTPAVAAGGGGAVPTSVPWLQFDLDFADGPIEGRLQWNVVDGTLEYGCIGGNVTLQIGQEQLLRVKNNSGFDIGDGEAVFVSGAQGERPEIELADASTGAGQVPIGVTTEPIDDGDQGFVNVGGLVRGIDTSPIVEGGVVFLSESTPGAFRATPPDAPNFTTVLGYCIKQDAVDGILFVRVLSAPRMQSLSDVDHTAPSADGQVYVWDTGNSRFELGDHGALTGLYEDDHDQYLLVDGTRAMTGDLDLGGFDINDCDILKADRLNINSSGGGAAGAGTIRLYGADDGAGNTEFLDIEPVGAMSILTKQTGGGSARTLTFGVGSGMWTVATTGHWYPSGGTFNIGTQSSPVGVLRLKNTGDITINDFSGTAVTVLTLDASDVLYLGNTSLAGDVVLRTAYNANHFVLDSAFGLNVLEGHLALPSGGIGVAGSSTFGGLVQATHETPGNSSAIVASLGGAHTATGTISAGHGTSHLFRLDDTAHNLDVAGYVAVEWTTPTSGAEDADFVWALMAGGAGAVNRMRLTSAGRLETYGGLVLGRAGAHTDVTLGLVVDQGTADDFVHAFESIGVTHGITDEIQTDSFGGIKKIANASGGLSLEGFTEDDEAVQLWGTATIENTAKSTAAVAPIMLRASVKSGTGRASMTADANILVARDHNAAQFIVDQEGEIHCNLTSTVSAHAGHVNEFDEFDDVALLSGFRGIMLGMQAPEYLARFVDYARPVLEAGGVVTFNEDGHHFVGLKRLHALQIDCIRQLAGRLAEVEAELAGLREEAA